MLSRCPESKFLTIGYRKGWKLVFDGYSEKRKGAVINAVPSETDILWGALYKISQNDLKRMDGFEDYPRSYQREKAEIICENGIIKAYFYFRKPLEIGKPSQEYLDVVLKGAEECNLPKDYIEKYIAHVEISDK
jgi:gamma-glutamylcyclotransferase (GGCT)/AIG2-like uncharacterized protein YtfP